jgi:hypothetical protein
MAVHANLTQPTDHAPALKLCQNRLPVQREF